ncbi:MAG TPA: quinolinate synthase NadA [Polyangia bacterium]|nr:quinolinate synthase NadA [Polyangia bacterium]
MKDQELKARLDELKRERSAVILVHNYQLPEVQDVADLLGDSLDLARAAAGCEAEVIVFGGVHFMAETAALLAPDKIVLLPDPAAGCPMAEMIRAGDVRALRLAHPGAVVVCYVNSTAAVKAECDVCCTSANAVEIVGRIPPGVPVVFVPDRHLGDHVRRLAGRELVLWPGHCPTHVRLDASHVAAARAAHPGAPVIVHPECRADVREAADAVLSTGQMVRFAAGSDAKTIVVGTEVGLLHRLSAENPGQRFVPLAEGTLCPNMKLATLEKLVWSLEDMQHRVTVPESVADRARLAVERMLGAGPIAPREADDG